MAVLTWDERVVAAVRRTQALSAEQFEAVCKMAVLLFHAEKQSRRRLTRAASSCGWSHQETEEAVLALAKVLMDAAKMDVTEHHLQSTLRGMRLGDAHVSILAKFFVDHREMIKANSTRPTHTTLSEYQSLDWRVDVEVENRMARNIFEPIVTLGLRTLPPASTATTTEAAEPTPGGASELTCVRVDYTNLKKLQHQLELALKEVDSIHCDRMQRYLRHH